jgi:transglutaminase-like putative cysteine protease
VLLLTSRFATRDRKVDLKSTPRSAPSASPAELKLALQPTELIPTDGIVRDTAIKITKGERTDVDKARAIYEWIVENTFRDAKVRGCGWGDIKGMLETGNLGGKCGDLNALFVGLSRSVGVPARDIYGVRVAKSEHGYVSLGANTESVTRARTTCSFPARRVGKRRTSCIRMGRRRAAGSIPSTRTSSSTR